MTSYSSCLICGSSQLYVSETFDTYKVISCRNCEFGLVDPVPTAEMLHELYNSPEYFATHMAYNFDEITDNEIRKNIDAVKSLHRQNLAGIEFKSKNMLEIGSGGGFALAAFSEMGFTTTGVETSAPAALFATERLKQKVIHTPFEDLQVKEGYDLVFLNHVLEHFVDVDVAMSKLNELVKTGGLLYVRVPDYDSYDRRSYGKKWPAHLHFHISNFSEKSLKILFRKYGFEVFRVQKYFSDRLPTWLKMLVRRLPFRSLWIDRVSGRTISVIARKAT
jgi:2-polyprenyl-3-methyl-5-hydroxy-6-metoxy-1,4-benzoquinol methylase